MGSSRDPEDKPPRHDADPDEEPFATRRRDTLPDGNAQITALLDGLVPKDGRAQPPRAIVKQRPQSAGEHFVAYSGEGRPFAGRATPAPMAAVIVEKDLGDLAREAGSVENTETTVDHATQQSTQVDRRRPSWVQRFVVVGIVLGLAAAAGSLLLRGSAHRGDAHSTSR